MALAKRPLPSKCRASARRASQLPVLSEEMPCCRSISAEEAQPDRPRRTKPPSTGNGKVDIDVAAFAEAAAPAVKEAELAAKPIGPLPALF